MNVKSDLNLKKKKCEEVVLVVEVGVVAAAAITCSDLHCGERRRLICTVSTMWRTSRDKPGRQ